jgi:hypothetical protein
MEKKPIILKGKLLEDFILIYFRQVPTHKGFVLHELSWQKPFECEFSPKDIQEAAQKLEEDGLIEVMPNSLGLHRLTKKGVVEAEKRADSLRDKDYATYRLFVAATPMTEIRQKIRDVQGFLVFSIFSTFLIITEVSSIARTKEVGIPDYINILLGIVFFILALRYFAYIILSVFQEFTLRYEEKVSNFIEKKKVLLVVLISLIIVAVLLYVARALGTPIPTIIGGVIITVVGIILTGVVDYVKKNRNLKNGGKD